MTDPTPETPPVEYTITATITTLSSDNADRIHSELNKVIQWARSHGYAREVGAELSIVDSTTPPSIGAWGKAVAQQLAGELDRRAGQLLGWAITFRLDDGRVVLDDIDLCGTVTEATALATSRDRDQFGDGPGRRGIAALHARPATVPAPATSEETAGA
ncbi:hypothetical protein [Glutamicibacter sp. V16R2B1]|uniref:hypothetical protein n=1 Tax=Glutamicibacter sp. V16R2B1 TaxID=2036207 RepID=UPI0010FF5762|nr:hypothetical protein [Glutamicibacter sp. V16R2B1]MCK9901235.1 hypothetical protein [Frankia sp. Cpl3]TLK46887.1 hypothetical protein FDN03_16065 [Glutamicibacter sp. V16R2B1]